MKHKEDNFVSAVLYIHSAQGRAGVFIENINKLLSDNFKKYEIVCVDDCSNDSSAKEIRNAAAVIGGGVVVLVTTGFYQGIEGAMLAGVDYSSGDYVFEFDSLDADYDPSLVMDVYRRSLSGYDIVGASSAAKLRKSSHLFYSVFNRYSKTQYKIQAESFRILSRRAINRVSQMSSTIPYRKAIYANCGLKYGSITYQPLFATAPTRADRSSYRQDLALDSFIIFTNVTLKICLLFTTLMMITTALVAIYAIVIFLEGSPVAGWTTIMLVLSAGFFGLFGVLSIIVKYLSVIIGLIFKKTKYTIGNIEKL